MKRLVFVAAVMLGALASACTTETQGKAATISWLQEQGMDESSAILLANNKPALRQYLTNRSMAPQDDAYCRSIGAHPGSDAYVQCRLSVASSRPVKQDQPRPTTIVVNQQQPAPPPQQPWPGTYQVYRNQGTAPLTMIGQ